MVNEKEQVRKRAEQELLGLIKELTRRTRAGELRWELSPDHDSRVWLTTSNRRKIYVGNFVQTIELCVDEYGSAVVQAEGAVKPFIGLISAIESQQERRSALSHKKKPVITRDVEEILKRLKVACAKS